MSALPAVSVVLTTIGWWWCGSVGRAASQPGRDRCIDVVCLAGCLMLSILLYLFVGPQLFAELREATGVVVARVDGVPLVEYRDEFALLLQFMVACLAFLPFWLGVWMRYGYFRS